MTGLVTIKSGNIYLDADVYETYFHGLDSVALLQRDGVLVMMPLRTDGSGGTLLKVMNSRGDRVVHAREFLASIAVDESEAIEVTARWDSDLAGLRLEITAE